MWHNTIIVADWALASYLSLLCVADGLGEIKYDIGYGGAFYALVDVRQLKMDLERTPLQELEHAGTSISEAIR